MEDIHVSLTPMIGAMLMCLLSIISYFLHRLIGQFDTLNETVKKIDKDLSGDIGILKNENLDLKSKIKDLDPLWDRVRKSEENIAVLQHGHCGSK